ncbi:Polyubiquitin-C [Oopsacas minuta]|uniref:Polyubiquitin-C n=1 Tax=Oopsacas minuta TaxID=111878 RepID=A0AAV7KA06_9METZ|nr:Polyubiquitin-C [Oopsacas minuta]
MRLGRMDLEVRTLTGRTIKYKMSPHCRVKDLQNKIEETEGLSPDLQYILTDKKKLSREDKLSEITMQEGDTLNLLSKIKAGLSIEIFDINGKKLTIEIDQDTTVYQLKSLINEKNNIAIESQRLVISHGDGMKEEIMMNKKKVVSYLRNDVMWSQNVISLLHNSDKSQSLEPLLIDEQELPRSIWSYICICFSI